MTENLQYVKEKLVFESSYRLLEKLEKSLK
jgi:hypothetical protein